MNRDEKVIRGVQDLADLDAEEKRLLQSFELHELEANHQTRPQHNSQEDAVDEGRIEENHQLQNSPEVPRSVEEEKSDGGNGNDVLGGTFGNPKHPEKSHHGVDGHHDTEHENNSEENHKQYSAEYEVKEGSAGEGTPKINGESDEANPFHWEQNSGLKTQDDDHLSKLVGLCNQLEKNPRQTSV